MPRLFVAVDLPADVREDIANICHGIPGVRFVDPAQMHLTLQFLGEVDEACFQECREVLSAVPSGTFTLSLKGVGYFPPRGRPRVLWVGVKECPELVTLNSRVQRALRPLGIRPERRRFSPHITIARLGDRADSSAVGRFIAAHALFETREFEVSQFHLYRSILRPAGAEHICEASYNGKPE